MQKICVVIPCYNEATRLPIDQIENFLLEADSDVHLLFVNDGSNDETAVLVYTLRFQFPERIRILNLPSNMGKAEAVRQGVLHSLTRIEYEYVAYFDADMSAPLSELSRLQSAMERHHDCGFAFGSRIKVLSNHIERSLARHYMGRVLATFTSLLLRLPVYDTQCGAKLFRASLARVLFGEPFISKWLFDVEIFARIIHYKGYNYAHDCVCEVPLDTWIEKSDSRISFADLLLMPFELWRIRRNYSTRLRIARKKRHAYT